MPLSSGPGRKSASAAIRSSKRLGRSCVTIFRMPPLSIWKTPVVVALAEQLVGLLVVERQRREIDGLVLVLLDQLDDVGQQRQRLQAEEVELDQTDPLDVAVRVLGEDGAVLVDEERQVLGERSVGDDDAGGVLGGVAEKPFELERVVEERLLALALAQLLQPRLELERLLERMVFPLDGRRIELRDAVGLAERELQDPADVLDRRLPLERPERDDAGDAILAVLLAHVADHLVAALVAEVDVDVGHRAPTGIQEALEEQVVRQRVEVGDAERVGDEAPRRRAASRADRDPPPFRPVDEVGDDQEVAREAHLLDDRELGFEALPVRRGRGAFERRALRAGARGEALLQAVACIAVESLLERLARLDAVHRELEARLQLELTAARHLDRVRDRLRHVGERRVHLVGSFHVELVGLELPARRIRERFPPSECRAGPRAPWRPRG